MNDEVDDDKLRERVHTLRVRIETMRERVRINDSETPAEQSKRRMKELEEELRTLRATKAALKKEIEDLESK